TQLIQQQSTENAILKLLKINEYVFIRILFMNDQYIIFIYLYFDNTINTLLNKEENMVHNFISTQSFDNLSFFSKINCVARRIFFFSFLFVNLHRKNK
ncbi:hypothetical protein BTA35_0217370, partial [Oceanospirillum linum]